MFLETIDFIEKENSNELRQQMQTEMFKTKLQIGNNLFIDCLKFLSMKSLQIWFKNKLKINKLFMKKNNKLIQNCKQISIMISIKQTLEEALTLSNKLY
jgi:hypothetical protein